MFTTLKTNVSSTYALAAMADKTSAGNGELGTDVVFVSPADLKKASFN
eukprot:CAMPEP_0173387190 /NCGR_PEP_ID=MMETSP1356-20130122/9723_1 /TAXON_ID=77927 ORGANISM="Hemiselmis virescens, Strain PCC157" /NCGR_SAMPLE_ID=MMETSP1356 /ASSEMBLY_ACC=CAM_ASM_000847 /LENGTH=47 /DNA_ID= /DNA_START= /DNA_END= /DNA_ORIENTATION=